MARSFTAQYAGICSKCDGRINTGDPITWARRGTKGIFHAACYGTDAPAATPTTERKIESMSDLTLTAPPDLFASTAPEPGWNDAPTPPQVVIVIEGGIVQEVLSTVPLDAGILDYDTEGADEVFDVPQSPGMLCEVAQACGHIESAAVNPSRVAELLEAINSKPEPHEECSADGCTVKVYPKDPYFATPCGTYCTEHMREHVKGCEICRNEFSEAGD